MSNAFLEQILNNFSSLKDDTFCNIIRGGECTTLTWGELEKECRNISLNLDGLTKNGVVLIFLRHSKELFSSFFGSMLSGNIPSFMPCPSPKQDTNLYWGSHQKLIDHIRPRAIISSDDMFSEMDYANLDLGRCEKISVDSLLPGEGRFHIRDSTSICLLQHSSGTTGLKKGVALSFDSVHSHAESYGSMISLSGEDNICSWLPLYHDMGLMACMVTPAYYGIEVTHLDPFEWVSQPISILEEMSLRSSTLTWMPNFAFEHLSNMCHPEISNLDFSSIRGIINCSETCRPESFDKFLESFSRFGISEGELHCCYAMAEAVFAVTQTQLGEAPSRVSLVRDSVNLGERVILADDSNTDSREFIETGSILDKMEVKIVNEKREIVDDYYVGEIAISGDFIMDGYYLNQELTSMKMDSSFYYTGDLGFFMEGKLFVLGRKDDLIIIQGRNIYAHQVEALLNSIIGLKPGRNVALGIDQNETGSQSLVVIAENDKSQDVPERQLKREILQVLESTINIVPRAIKIVDSGWLVKTTSGKIGRKENAKKYLGAE